jgi:signal transduction histidine kinase
VLDELAARAQAKNIHLESTIEANLPALEMNPKHAKQLWINLISNAVKYTNEGGKVHVSLHQENKHLVGAVSDTGIGIPDGEIDLIFEEFYRSKAGKVHTQMGTGLGLPIVKRILDTYGGEIEVQSETGQGSTFTFRLPLSSARTVAI